MHVVKGFLINYRNARISLHHAAASEVGSSLFRPDRRHIESHWIFLITNQKQMFNFLKLLESCAFFQYGSKLIFPHQEIKLKYFSRNPRGFYSPDYYRQYLPPPMPYTIPLQVPLPAHLSPAAVQNVQLVPCLCPASQEYSYENSPEYGTRKLQPPAQQRRK